MDGVVLILKTFFNTAGICRGVFIFFLLLLLSFSFPMFTVGQGFGSLPTSSASSIIDAGKTLLFYLQLGGCEPVVDMACGGLFIDCVHIYTCTHTHSHTHRHTCACTHFPFQLPAALLNWRISGSEMKLVNLNCFYDWLDMICIIIWTQCSFSLSRCLPPTHSLSPSHSFHYLDWLLWNRP